MSRNIDIFYPNPIGLVILSFAIGSTVAIENVGLDIITIHFNCWRYREELMGLAGYAYIAPCV